MFRFVVRLTWVLTLLSAPLASAAGKAEHVVVIVWDGMRPDFVTREYTPTLYQLAQDGVTFQNHHAVFCTSTQVNGTAIATGTYQANSGIIANRMYRPDINLLNAIDTQSRTVVRRGDQLSDGHYLLRPTVAEALHGAGRKTAIAGSKAVALLHDRQERSADSLENAVVYEGRTLPVSLLTTITNRMGAFPAAAASSGADPNEKRDVWTTRAMLEVLWSNAVPAFSLLWLSEPDFSQHNNGPGSPRVLAALQSSDRRLAEVLAELDRRQLRDKTDVFVVSDHGFSTVDQAVDVSLLLQQAGFPAKRIFIRPPNNGDILVVGQGGAVLFYVVGNDHEMARKLVDFLQQQDFSGALFTREPMPGTFGLEDANIRSPHPPDVVLSMRWSPDKSKIGVPGVFASDGSRKPGGGNHASLSRFDVHNTLIGAGPDLKKGFTNNLPTANTDLAPTILWLLGVVSKERMDGRVFSEALTVDGPPVGEPIYRDTHTRRELERGTWTQYLKTTRVNETVYLDEGNGSWTPK